MEYKKTFGETVRAARKKQGITQKELAQIVGITPTYCRCIEKGKYSPTWIIWLKICTVLDIDIQKLAEQYIKPEIREIGQYLGVKI